MTTRWHETWATPVKCVQDGCSRLLHDEEERHAHVRESHRFKPNEAVDHPKHYNDHPSGVECITITEHFNFNIGNAIKYLWRAGLKGDAEEDLRKAAWYVQREIERMGE